MAAKDLSVIVVASSTWPAKAPWWAGPERDRLRCPAAAPQPRAFLAC